MDLFQIILFAALIIGILLITVSMFLFNRENSNTAVDYLERGNTIKAIDASINELDKTMEEFESLSKSAFDELDAKYQEILFLYSLMNEKKQEIANVYYSDDNPVRQEPQLVKEEVKQEIIESDRSVVRQYKNPKSREIFNLLDQGHDITEIAKQLNMGINEVRLIVELSKANG